MVFVSESFAQCVIHYAAQSTAHTAGLAGLAGVPGDIADTGPSISWYLFKCVRVLS